jgi:YVTN family beta-propeller protein
MRIFVQHMLLLLCSANLMAQPPNGSVAGVKDRITLPNGWSLTPAGKSLPLGDLPLNIAVSPSGNLLAVTNNGQSTQSIQLIDRVAEEVLDSLDIPKSWMGLKFSGDGKYLYASGGNDNQILQYAIKGKKLVLQDSLVLGKPWPERISPAGIDIDDQRELLYVVTKENNSLYLISLRSRQVIGRFPMPGEGYTCLLSPDRKELYVTCWGCDRLLVFDTKKKQFSAEIAVGDNPNDECLSKSGKYLFVANANDNSVSVIDLKSRRTLQTLNAALYPTAPSGSTTNGLALSEDDKTLYIANADNNCLAVFDVSQPSACLSKGFIPVGWYPTAVKVVGHTIYVANGKGFSSSANPYGPNPTRRKEDVVYEHGDRTQPRQVQYIGGLFKGMLSIISEPDQPTLAAYSQLVYQNTPYTKAGEMETSGGEPSNPVPRKIGAASPIKYVFYIIKENRTYDQVLGDIAGANGDTSLVLFGERITPNQHALAKQFVLLDNFYCDGEVSSDGHNWSMGAYATDYLEKTWPTGYGDRGGDYDGEGNRAIANNKTGFIWDHCQKAEVSYRTYGEFADDFKPNIPALKDHLCTYYTGFDLDVRDTARVSLWKRDFDSLLQAHALPKFNSVRLGNDHTQGLRLGKPTPFAQVADNDLAVGEFVEYLSQSPVWKESVVFILEDDAQNGPDHVDAHRTTAYIAGGYVRRNFVDHTMYSTSSVLRTLELILGIAPMSQYDAAAAPMWRCFANHPDVSGFRAVPARVNLEELNVTRNALSTMSAGFDFSKEDRVPEAAFNEVLWKSVKGLDSPVPAPRCAAFVQVVVPKAREAD